jgi:hypothetical protein
VPLRSARSRLKIGDRLMVAIRSNPESPVD